MARNYLEDFANFIPTLIMGSDYANNQAETKLNSAKVQMMQNQMDMQKKFQDWLMNSGGRGSPVGGVNGMGIKGMTINPITGEMSVNMGETDIAKSQREQVQKTNETISKEEASAGNALALLDSLEKDWIATKPPKSGALGINGAGILPQPLYGIGQRIGAPLQITRNQQADYKYVRRVKSLMSRLAKGVIGQDVGNLSYFEQQAAMGGVAGLTDTYETGKSMFESARRLIKDMKEARKAGYKSLEEKLKADGRVLTKEQAAQYLQQAGGDPNKARQLAAKDRWAF